MTPEEVREKKRDIWHRLAKLAWEYENAKKPLEDELRSLRYGKCLHEHTDIETHHSPGTWCCPPYIVSTTYTCRDCGASQSYPFARLVDGGKL